MCDHHHDNATCRHDRIISCIRFWNEPGEVSGFQLRSKPSETHLPSHDTNVWELTNNCAYKPQKDTCHSILFCGRSDEVFQWFIFLASRWDSTIFRIKLDFVNLILCQCCCRVWNFQTSNRWLLIFDTNW